MPDLECIQDIANRLCAERGWGRPEYIDHGASAVVYKTQQNNEHLAVKIYDPTYFLGENALIEKRRIALQCELNNHGCPYIINILDAAEFSECKTWFLLMEYCPWKSIEKKLKNIPDNKIHIIVKQLVKSVIFLNKKGLVHRDIKPANIVISDEFDKIKLLDFGVMRRISYDEGSGTDGHKFIATAQYSPPEFLTRDEISGQEGYDAINIYQIGAVLHDLIVKNPIFFEEIATKNKFILYKAVTEKTPRIVSAAVPSRLIALCAAALQKSPEARVASVSLRDFLDDIDDLETIRRRVTKVNPDTKNNISPTIANWQSKVRSWGREAAFLESDSLGSATMKIETINDGKRWEVAFTAVESPVFLSIVKCKDILALHVTGSRDEEYGAPITIIDSQGARSPESGIPEALAAAYLFALDRALANGPSDGAIVEAGK